MNKTKWYDKELIQKVNNETRKALLKACIMVEGDAKILVPVDTGRLRSSITHEVEKTVGRVGTNVEYAKHVEFGTVKMGPKPYLRPALHRNEKKIEKMFKNLIK